MQQIERIHVFGDTGGHGRALYEGLLAIGLDATTLRLPAGVQVIQVGDLIHKGPNSNAIVEFVDKILVRNPGQWIQLFGNHEAQHIGGPKFWRCDCDELTLAILNRWYKMGEAHFAHAIDGGRFDYPARLDDRSLLVSHAGVTWRFWNRLEKPATAFELIERMSKIAVKEVLKPGMMLVGGQQLPDGRVIPAHPGPVWALSTFEVYDSWNHGDNMPFAQIHGHTTAYGWMSKRWWPVPDGFIKATQLDAANRVSTTRVARSQLIGVDPGFSERIDLAVQPSFTLNAR